MARFTPGSSCVRNKSSLQAHSSMRICSAALHLAPLVGNSSIMQRPPPAPGKWCFVQLRKAVQLRVFYLVRGEFRFAPEFHAPTLRSLRSGAGPFAE